MLPKSKFTMAGTEGTGQYVGVAATARGAVAVREYYPGAFRVRVEPTTVKSSEVIGRILTPNAGWKQPVGQNRFSKMTGVSGLSAVLNEAISALGVGYLKSTELDLANALRHIAERVGVKLSTGTAKNTILGRITAGTGASA